MSWAPTPRRSKKIWRNVDVAAPRYPSRSPLSCRKRACFLAPEVVGTPDNNWRGATAPAQNAGRSLSAVRFRSCFAIAHAIALSGRLGRATVRVLRDGFLSACIRNVGGARAAVYRPISHQAAGARLLLKARRSGRAASIRYALLPKTGFLAISAQGEAHHTDVAGHDARVRHMLRFVVPSLLASRSTRLSGDVRDGSGAPRVACASQRLSSTTRIGPRPAAPLRPRRQGARRDAPRDGRSFGHGQNRPPFFRRRRPC
jgi:hypothetical protein